MYQCDICKRTNETPMTWFIEEELFLCESCGSQLHTCRGCTSRQNCELETNPQQIPPFIIKTFQQG